MKASSYIYIFFLTLLSLCVSEKANCQWKNIAPGLLGDQGGMGAIHYCDGTIWVGVDSLLFSNDTGKTWQASVLPLQTNCKIHDIYFLDKLNGIISTSNSGVLLTKDGGKTWKLVLETGGDFWKAQFNGSPQIIHALGIDKGVCYTSTNGGSTWDQIFLGQFVSCLAIAPDHTVYVFAQQSYLSSTEGWIASSTDFGKSWKASPITTDGDSYTLSVDSCDKKRLYLLNEDYASTNDNVSQIFITSDAGESWQTTDTNKAPYFSGVLVTTKHALYAATTKDKIVRSTDKGQSWKSIGGPVVEVDSRTIATINDNTLFVLDYQGNVWATFNSGGDSLPSFSTESKFNFSSSRIINDSTNIIVHLPIYLTHSGNNSDVDMIMHYPTQALKLLSTTLYNGKTFDIANNQWAGRAALHFSGAEIKDAPTSLLGYINFLWTPHENDCSDIDFDSITIPGIDLCSLSEVNTFHGIIGSFKTCGVSSVANADIISKKPLFAFTPNPAGDYGFISTDTFSGDIQAKLFDNSGKMVTIFKGSVSRSESMKVILRNLPDGIYHLSLKGEHTEYELTFVHANH